MKYFLVALSILLSSCVKQNRIDLKNDFESDPPSGWSNTNIKKGNGRSGENYSFAKDSSEFSATFCKKLSDITDKKIKRIDIICWIRILDENSAANFVFNLDKNEKNVYYDAQSSKGAAPIKNEWSRMHSTYDLPDSLGRDEVLKVFLWNKSPSEIDVDDFEIKLYY